MKIMVGYELNISFLQPIWAQMISTNCQLELTNPSAFCTHSNKINPKYKYLGYSPKIDLHQVFF